MTARGGTYSGPGGEPLHGDGKPVGKPADPLKQLEEEIRAIKPEDYPVCPGCGEKHAPGEGESNQIAGVNVIDMAKGAGGILNQVPVQHAVPMIASFIGSFAEAIGEEMWARLLAHQHEPCGQEGCDCHIAMQTFLPALHKLKTTAVEGRKRGFHLDEEEEKK